MSDSFLSAFRQACTYAAALLTYVGTEVAGRSSVPTSALRDRVGTTTSALASQISSRFKLSEASSYRIAQIALGTAVVGSAYLTVCCTLARRRVRGSCELEEKDRSFRPLVPPVLKEIYCQPILFLQCVHLFAVSCWAWSFTRHSREWRRLCIITACKGTLI